MDTLFWTIMMVSAIGVIVLAVAAFHPILSAAVADANGQDALDREVERMFRPDGHGIYPAKGGDPFRTPD
jgi:hypothetical protein